MYRLFVAALFCVSLAAPVAAQEQPASAAEQPQFLGADEPGSRVAAASGVNLSSCLHACDSGTAAIQNYCRSLPPDPELRTACWAVTLGSVPLCKGFCYAWATVK